MSQLLHQFHHLLDPMRSLKLSPPSACYVVVRIRPSLLPFLAERARIPNSSTAMSRWQSLIALGQGSRRYNNMDNEAEALDSPSSASFNSKLLLPLSCDPPGPQNPPRQRVWVVSLYSSAQTSSLHSPTSTEKPIPRSLALQATWAALLSKPPLPTPILSQPSAVAWQTRFPACSPLLPPRPIPPWNHRPTSPSSATSVSAQPSTPSSRKV